VAPRESEVIDELMATAVAHESSHRATRAWFPSIGQSGSRWVVGVPFKTTTSSWGWSMSTHRERGVPLVVLAVLLAFVSGATDITSFARLGGVFASVMTGNLVLLGLAVARSSGELAAHSGITFVGYISGVALASRIAAQSSKSEELWPPVVTKILMIEFAAFVGFTIGWGVAGGRPSNPWQLGLLVLASFAMGLQSGAVRKVGVPLSTTYLTGTITSTVASLVSQGQPRKGVRLNVAVIVAAAAGAASAGGLLITSSAWVPAILLVCIAGVIAIAATVETHQ
jgi:uncharacterized membrane protein YoaK (UPF0700 family)